MSTRRKVGRYVLDKRIGCGSFASVWRGHVLPERTPGKESKTEEKGEAVLGNATRAARAAADGLKSANFEGPVVVEEDVPVGTVEMGEGEEYNGVVVAVKVIRREAVQQALQLSHEVSVLKLINHPNIVRFKDLKKSSSHYYLVLEYCGGGDLASFLARRGRVDEHTARSFLLQMASGLKVLHEMNFLHRDLKPQNILLSDQSSAPTVKIADFGFARGLKPSEMAATICGSPLYMAPEILRYESYDVKADLWSLGAIMYELLYGRPPFSGRNPLQLLKNIESERGPTFPGEIPISNQCRDLLWHLLDPEPCFRLSSALFAAHPYLNNQRFIRQPTDATIPQPSAMMTSSGCSFGLGGVSPCRGVSERDDVLDDNMSSQDEAFYGSDEMCEVPHLVLPQQSDGGTMAWGVSQGREEPEAVGGVEAKECLETLVVEGEWNMIEMYRRIGCASVTQKRTGEAGRERDGLMELEEGDGRRSRWSDAGVWRGEEDSAKRRTDNSWRLAAEQEFVDVGTMVESSEANSHAVCGRSRSERIPSDIDGVAATSSSYSWDNSETAYVDRARNDREREVTENPVAEIASEEPEMANDETTIPTIKRSESVDVWNEIGLGLRGVNLDYVTEKLALHGWVRAEEGMQSFHGEGGLAPTISGTEDGKQMWRSSRNGNNARIEQSTYCRPSPLEAPFGICRSMSGSKVAADFERLPFPLDHLADNCKLPGDSSRPAV
eukprot:GHVS01085650.1.p1 GENE.GHVS01085650.1~~GHVS01085650.1.p1  ORF type:complete len:723 (+),score=103.10 GHVS01085650.1:102-2270(+)